jgi:hypothetical protein
MADTPSGLSSKVRDVKASDPAVIDSLKQIKTKILKS